jgi:hypothetical protein
MVAAQLIAVSKPKTAAQRRRMSEIMRKVWENPAAHGLHTPHRWTDEEIALLATDYDSVIAERIGVAPHIVEQKRRRLGIPGIVERWSAEEIALLGTRNDRAIAADLGKSEAAVRGKRQRLGIPPFVARWREDEILLLGTDTDRAIAEKIGRTHSAVESQRLALGIPTRRLGKRGGVRGKA